MKKALKIVFNVIAWVVLIFALLITILVFSSDKNNGTASLLGYIPLTVESDSMKPTFKKGDLIISKEIDDINSLKKGDVITKAVPKGNDYSIVSAYTSDEHYNEILVNTFNSSKSGTTKVLVNVKRGKKTYKLSMKVKVISFASPIQSAKVGKKNVKKYISNVPYGLLKKDCSGKLSIKMKKGWKIQKIEQTVNGKTKKIKNNKKINTAKGAILITVKNAKLNQIEELKLAKPNF